jgi:membrane protease YdiL (CAAX protease family)
MEMSSISANTTVSEFPQHSVLESIGLHIIPGVLLTAAFIVLKPLADAIGYPPLLAFILAVLLVDIPFQLGVMYYQVKKLNGRYSLQGIVLYREKIPWWQFLIIFLVGVVLLFGLSILAMPVNSFLSQQLFAWLPDWIFLNDAPQYEAYSQGTLLVTLTLFLIVTGIALPWIEELYFRGFLMPRISRFKAWTPIFSALLFALYHVWQLFDFTAVFFSGLVFAFAVWWKRDVRLGISLHVAANLLARIMIFFLLLGDG